MSDDLNPIRVVLLFKGISAAGLELLDMPGRPEDLIMTALPVPPLAIRPSVEMDIGGGSNEDDITMVVKVCLYCSLPCSCDAVLPPHPATSIPPVPTVLSKSLQSLMSQCNSLMQTIMDANAQIRASLDNGVKLEGGSGLMELWDFLQLKCASYINSDLPGLGQAFTQAPPGKPLRCAPSYRDDARPQDWYIMQLLTRLCCSGTIPSDGTSSLLWYQTKPTFKSVVLCIVSCP